MRLVMVVLEEENRMESRSYLRINYHPSFSLNAILPT